LKAYINEDIRCAEWFLREFTSFKLVHEVLVENTQKVMRLVFFGITQAAIAKVYQKEQGDLNNYWQDVKAGLDPPRQTILGNFILVLLHHLPVLRNFTATF
jgi:hypothetical protein